MATEPVVRREIETSDLDAVALCLRRNFPRRRLAFWKYLLRRLAEAPDSGIAPRYGYLLEVKGGVVGTLLTIGHKSELSGAPAPRCNFSSWCVDPAYRSFGGLLPMRALKRGPITFTNLTAAPHTVPMIEALGFQLYAKGAFVVDLWRHLGRDGARIVGFDPEQSAAQRLTPWERAMLSDHRRYGLSALVGLSKDGYATPFVLKTLPPWRDPWPSMLLLYGRSEVDLARFSGALARHCLLRGRVKLVLGANGPVAGLAGRYVEGRTPRYFRGPAPPTVTDLAYSELALL